MKYKKRLHIISLLIAAGLATLTAHAAPVIIPSPPKTPANAYLLLDFNSGQHIVEHAINERMPPASLTKIMTVYVAAHELQNGKMSYDDEVLVSEKAWRMPGSRMFIEVGKKIKLSDLLKGIIVQSGNDASVALAEYIAGNEETFAAMMNHHAKRLGMKNTHYMNSTGLPDDNHYTTAHDLAILSRALIREFGEVYAMHAQRFFTFADIKQSNRNKLLWRDKSFDGIKTGHTEAAGYCLVATAKRDDMRLITVIMGAHSDAARTRAGQSLTDFGFQFYKTHRLYRQHETIQSAPIWKGRTNSIQLGVAEDVFVTVRKGGKDNLQHIISLPPTIIAPVTTDAVLGDLEIKYADELLFKLPLVALEDVPIGGLLKRAKDSVLLWMN